VPEPRDRFGEMRITLLRNATLVIEGAEQRLVVDPSLGPPRRWPPLSLIRSRPALNPTVPLPDGSRDHLAGITGALVTHFRLGHADHLDAYGKRLLAGAGVPTACQPPDARRLRRAGIDARPVSPDRTIGLLGGELTSVPALHGRGLVGRMMGPGAGFLLRLAGEPSLYLSGDTVLTDDVRGALEREQPDIAVLHSGGAQLDIGSPILMTLEEQREFICLAPGRVIAVHLEALDHCGITRAKLRDALEAAGALDQVDIPADGQTISVSAPATGREESRA
jgi:L-ascorbate metabolism protein UlaG (beta-lactamase superfamily)